MLLESQKARLGGSAARNRPPVSCRTGPGGTQLQSPWAYLVQLVPGTAGVGHLQESLAPACQNLDLAAITVAASGHFSSLSLLCSIRTSVNDRSVKGTSQHKVAPTKQAAGIYSLFKGRQTLPSAGTDKVKEVSKHRKERFKGEVVRKNVIIKYFA